jgi:pyruvate formate lyase activating enzyme
VKKEALLYKRLRGKEVRCETCNRFCRIRDGKLGFCKTRKNVGGRLYTLVYGEISSLSPNPIEKKPLFHFYPGSRALTVGTVSCTFACPFCQNWEISKATLEKFKTSYLPPEDLIELCKRYNCEGTSISFNEPTLLLEYSLDVFKLARKERLYNTFVTNGYFSSKALDLLAKHCDAMNVDLKGDEKFYRNLCKIADPEPIWRNCIEARRKGIHIELTTLIIPGYNDDPNVIRGIARRAADEIGEDTPYHLTRFYPAYEFRDLPPTPIATLEKAREIALEEGLRYVYLGNIPGHPGENTYCANCKELLIERYGMSVIRVNLSKNTCPRCGEEIPLVGEAKVSSPFF